MTSTRHLIDDDLWEYFKQVARKLGYMSTGKKSGQKLLLKLLEYADQPKNAKLFKL